MKKKSFTILIAVIAIVGVTHIYNVAKPYNAPKAPADCGGGGAQTDTPY